MEENWDLEAIVRGCSSDFATSIMEDMSSQSCPFVPFDVQQDDLYDFYDCFAKNNTTSHHIFNEELHLHHHTHDHELHNPLILNQQQQPLDASANITTPTTTRRRKNQQKRVVKQVAADDLSSDTWAWRKYGQKPIKGSPYPRSYYRCSSLKGCLARKQVERSSSDPTMFIISYTAEHSHSHPVRRNSLAGIAKKKSPKNPKTTSDPGTSSSLCHSPLSSSTTVFSPTSPLVSCTEHELFLCHEIKGDDKIMEETANTMMSNDVFFSGIEGDTTFDMEGFDSWFDDQIL